MLDSITSTSRVLQYIPDKDFRLMSSIGTALPTNLSTQDNIQIGSPKVSSDNGETVMQEVRLQLSHKPSSQESSEGQPSSNVTVTTAASTPSQIAIDMNQLSHDATKTSEPLFRMDNHEDSFCVDLTQAPSSDQDQSSVEMIEIDNLSNGNKKRQQIPDDEDNEISKKRFKGEDQVAMQVDFPSEVSANHPVLNQKSDSIPSEKSKSASGKGEREIKPSEGIIMVGASTNFLKQDAQSDEGAGKKSYESLRNDASEDKILKRDAQSDEGAGKKSDESSRNETSADKVLKRDAQSDEGAGKKSDESSRNDTSEDKKTSESSNSNDALIDLKTDESKELTNSSEIVIDTATILNNLSCQLDPIPDMASLPKLDKNDEYFLEAVLQIDEDSEETWQSDWAGNLNFIDKEIILNKDKIKVNPSLRKKSLTFLELVVEDAYNKNDATTNGFRGILLLFSRIYHMKETPPTAKKILAYSLLRPAKSIEQRYDFIAEVRNRLGYDPQLLKEDGWTVVKAGKPEGKHLGAYLIGEKVVWEKSEAVIIAHLYDSEGIGDLWKVLFVEDHESFDLEADEMQEGLKKMARRESRNRAKREAELQGYGKKSSSRSSRNKMTVPGIEYGIIMATSSSMSARNGVKWPARVLNVSEVEDLLSSTSRRSSVKNSIPVMFLAPYWNGANTAKGKASSATASNPFSSGPLFQLEYIDVNPENIEEYTHEKVSLSLMRAEFQFSGLPAPAFTRYVNAHRMAIALRNYAKEHIVRCHHGENIDAIVTLTDAHIMSVKSPTFPDSVLNLPYDHLMNQLPCPVEQSITESNEEEYEPVIDFNSILDAMKPPYCFGGKISRRDNKAKSIEQLPSPICNQVDSSPSPRSLFTRYDKTELSLEKLASYNLLKFLQDETTKGIQSGSLTSVLEPLFKSLHTSVCVEVPNFHDQRQRVLALNTLMNRCMMVKAHGEDILSTCLSNDKQYILLDWRKACEQLYRVAVAKYSIRGLGLGVTVVVTDMRCNGHITADDSFERSVRLPAAIKGAKLAGAGTRNLPLLSKVDDSYYEIAEKLILPKAHNATYLRKMKNKIAAIPVNVTGYPLTDISDEESGGDDTKGSRGSFVAAVTGVAAAIQAVDMIIGGQCVNAFCAVRPPGHHAGKQLRAMNAISNGFCLLNSVACAAIYAVTPIAEGGRGLKRVVVFDFDVHHGNGTQDILCSTHDSRFLYISIHAGGAHINGYEDSDESDTEEYSRRSLGGNKDGIFPGKCGDTSPHSGVLNIPLGKRVTSIGVGTALMTKVKPAIEKFSPDLMILSAGFDAHMNDPLGMGGLSAADFGTVTNVACKIAEKCCSGRVLSLLEGGYGVPCCKPLRNDMFLPDSEKQDDASYISNGSDWKTLDLGENMPTGMQDNIPPGMVRILDKCHNEGFLECVKEHVGALKDNSSQKT